MKSFVVMVGLAISSVALAEDFSQNGLEDRAGYHERQCAKYHEALKKSKDPKEKQGYKESIRESRLRAGLARQHLQTDWQQGDGQTSCQEAE